MQVIANGINIEVEDHGNPQDPAILLVMGYTAQLIYWPMDFVNGLVDKGFRVVTFDNRDVGLSYKFDGVRGPNPIRQLIAKRFFPKRQMAPYNLSDMARDAVGVLDALEIDQAHIVGASMGGMIGQLIAADHADRVLSFTPIMSSTNGPGL
ncbi:MAG: alpha/beta hydrolase, partial [Sphingomonadales bacterium]|nr:alpha/beta hydrolase [Sphingomonadales bacterium]